MSSPVQISHSVLRITQLGFKLRGAGFFSTVPLFCRGMAVSFLFLLDPVVAAVAQALINLCLTLCDPMVCSTPGFPVRHQLVETTQAHVHCIIDAIQYLIFFCPLLLPPSIFPSIKIFSNELALCIRWPKYWSFSFSISPSNEYSGLISFRMDWLDLLAVQGTLKSLFQHNSKTSVLWFSAFFLVQLSRPHRTTGKPGQDST